MKAQAESRQTLVLGVYAREFPGGLLEILEHIPPKEAVYFELMIDAQEVARITQRVSCFHYPFFLKSSILHKTIAHDRSQDRDKGTVQ